MPSARRRHAALGLVSAARLALLKRLRDEGLIDAAEYEAKKAEIIAGL